MAVKQYDPPPCSAGLSLTLFRATEQPKWIVPDPTLGWKDLAKGCLRIIDVKGFHGAVVYEPQVRFLAEKLSECLNDADSRYSETLAELEVPEEVRR